jgi:opacity protein-like surface antigen
MYRGNIARGDLSPMTIRYGLAAIAVIVASASVPAGAQPQPVAIPAKDFGPVWTGFYVGAAFGAGGAVNKLDSTTPALSTTFDGGGGSGVLRSIYGGVDYQITQRGIIGLMAELSYSGFQGSASAQVRAPPRHRRIPAWVGGAGAPGRSPTTTLLYRQGYAGRSSTQTASPRFQASATFPTRPRTAGPSWAEGCWGRLGRIARVPLL